MHEVPILNGQVRVIQIDQEISIKCYVESLKLKRACNLGVGARKANPRINLLEEACKGDRAPPPSNEEFKD